MKSLCLGFLIVFILCADIAKAECSDNCWQYCGPSGSHGYCTDYIYSRLGARQSGNASQWYGNVNASDVQANDVAIFGSTGYGHVAVVDSVSGDNITISEWNYGSTLINSICGVTDKYKVKTTRTISKSSVSRFWRPNGNSNDSNSVELNVRVVNDMAWYPANVDCFDAELWFTITNDRCIIKDSSICYEVLGICPAQ